MKTVLRSFGFCFLLLVCFFCSIKMAQQPLVKAGAGGVDFQRAVRPILSDNCFQCHGPDKNTRMVDLRLDTKEGAYEVRDSGTVIVPGKPQESLLYQRISAEDPARRMPPESSHKSLTPQQIELLKKWIEQGAGVERALVVRSAGASGVAGGQRQGLGTESD